MKKEVKKEPLVTGIILIGKKVEPFSGATAHVRLEDVSNADAASRVVAEQTLRNVSHTKGDETKLKFALYGKLPNERASYSVSAHVDLDNDGEVSVGDYISMESYPVLTYGYPSYVEVRVHRVE